MNTTEHKVNSIPGLSDYLASALMDATADKDWHTKDCPTLLVDINMPHAAKTALDEVLANADIHDKNNKEIPQGLIEREVFSFFVIHGMVLRSLIGSVGRVGGEKAVEEFWTSVNSLAQATIMNLEKEQKSAIVT